jgi:hypothetical protein
LTNAGSASSGISWTFPDGTFKNKEAMVDVLSCTVMHASAKGGLTVQAKNGLPQVLRLSLIRLTVADRNAV